MPPALEKMVSPHCDTVPVKPSLKLNPAGLGLLHQKGSETRNSQTPRKSVTCIGCRLSAQYGRRRDGPARKLAQPRCKRIAKHIPSALYLTHSKRRIST